MVSGELTTVMLRNIPNKYSTDMLLKLVNSKGFEGKYDFFYLPMDFANKCGKGYCFINFRDPIDAQKCSKSFDKFNQWVFKSVKVCAATFAVVQGLKDNCDKMRGSPVVTDPSIPDDFKPILIGENGSRTVLGRDTSREVGHVLSPFAEEFVPGGVSRHDVLDMLTKISTRPKTTVGRHYEIVYDIQIKHIPERNTFNTLLYIEGRCEQQLLSIIHMAPGVDVRLVGPPLHLVVGADSPEVFELGKHLIEQHLQNVYASFAKFALKHGVEDLRLKVRPFLEKRPEVTHEVPALSEPECEPQSAEIENISKKFVDELDRIEPLSTDANSETVSYSESPRDRCEAVPYSAERCDYLVVTPPPNVASRSPPGLSSHFNRQSAAYICKGFVNAHREWDKEWHTVAEQDKENVSKPMTPPHGVDSGPIATLRPCSTHQWLSAS